MSWETLRRLAAAGDDGPKWWDQVKERAVMESVAPKLALKPGRGNSWGPCPACGQEKRSSNSGDGRGPIGAHPSKKGWVCHRCKVTGSVLDLVSWRLTGDRLDARSSDAKDVRTWCAREGLCEDAQNATCGAPMVPRRPLQPTIQPKPPTKHSRPVQHELTALWGTASSAVDVWRTYDVAAFIERRADFQGDEDIAAVLAELDVARVLPTSYVWPSWWRASWSPSWRLAVRAHEADGTFVSLHARRIDNDDKPKTRWPYQCSASGLIMASPIGGALLRGQSLKAECIWVVEGLTDLVAAELTARREGIAAIVLSAASGSFSAFGSVDWPDSVRDGTVPVYARTDDDPAGNGYAHQINTALAPLGIPVRRLPWEKQ